MSLGQKGEEGGGWKGEKEGKKITTTTTNLSLYPAQIIFSMG